MKSHLKAISKRLLSYTKKEWTLENYPLHCREQKEAPDDCKWIVRIINWRLSGLGETKEKALEDLRQNFDKYRETNKKLPRPGTKVPLKFADSTLITSLEDEAVAFFDRILELDYHCCFISDESSLWDFDLEEEEILNKINKIYDLKLDCLGDGNIANILTAIKENQAKPE